VVWWRPAVDEERPPPPTCKISRTRSARTSLLEREKLQAAAAARRR
jgi:hypothetical protein